LAVEDVVKRIVVPSDSAFCSNQLAPRIDPPPGRSITLISGLPGRCFSK